MASLKIAALYMAVLIALHAFGVTASHSESPATPVLDEELAKQADIYRSRGEDVPQGYITGRSLLSYTFILSPDFTPALADLGPEDRWLDIGAGEGRAVVDYCTSRYDAVLMQAGARHDKKAKAIALSIEDRRTIYWYQTAASLKDKQIEYFFGRRLREYSPEELGQFQLMTDVMGGFSYTRYLSLFIEKALGFLELHGSFYTLLQDVGSERRMNEPFYPDSPFLTEIANADGSKVSICSWLKSITCVEVACELRAEWSPPIERYHIRKVCNNVTVPSVVLTHFVAGTPPERRFQLSNASPSSPGSTGATR